MQSKLVEFVSDLEEQGWKVQRRSDPAALPEMILQRYDWLPAEIREFVSELDFASAPDGKAWFITNCELKGRSDSAFSWNQWEVDSLRAAEQDKSWQQEIEEFWNNHFPILISVRDGYRYLAVRRDSLIVGGMEPEFEETEQLASTFLVFLEDFQSDRIVRYT